MAGNSTPSPASDFAEPETTVVQLPRKGAGAKDLFVKIRAVAPVDLVQAMEGVPDLGAAPSEKSKSWDSVRELILSNEKPQQRVVAAGVIEPMFWFDTPEDGKAPWKNVHAENQAFIVRSIMDISGFGVPVPGSPAAKAESFRGVAADEGVGDEGAAAEGGSAGRGAVGGVEAAAAAE